MKNTPQSSYESFDITKYTPWINLLSKNNNIEIVIDTSFSHTAAINLQNLQRPRIILNPKMMKEKFNYSDEEIMFDIGHELGHFEEEFQLQSTVTGKQIAQERIQRLEEKGNLFESYHTLENICRDVSVNTELISPQKLPILKDTCYTNYRDKMFKEKDYLNLPKHLQFDYTIIREKMVADEICTIDPHVRKIITRLKKSGILEKTIAGPLKDRLQTMWEYIEPIYQKLLQEDIKKQEEENKNKGNKEDKNNSPSQKEKGVGDEEKSPNEQNNQTPSNQKSKKDKKSIIKQLQQLLSGEKGEQSNEALGENKNPLESSEIPSGNLQQSSEKNLPLSSDKNPFDELYQNIPKVPNILESELSDEDKEKLKQVLQDIYDDKHREKTREEMELEQRVKNMGINPSDKAIFQQTMDRLKEYDRFFAQLEQIKDINTGNTVMEEIEHVFERIRSHRTKPRYKAKGPVDIDHGYRLHPGVIAQGIAEVKGGNYNPEMFEMDIKHEKPEQLTGRFELTLIGDGSGSMDQNNKNAQQKIAVLLILEALKRLHDRLIEEKHNLKEGVEFTTQALLFLQNMKGVLYGKNLGSDFVDSERLTTYEMLDHADGSTNDFDGLQEILDQMKGYSREHLQEIQTGKTIKIIIVLSDGGSDDPEKMKSKIKALRDKGVLVYGIGITSSGKPVENLFDATDKNLGYGQVCEHVEHLAQTLKDILWMHIEKL